jgi:hypothetical protein
MIMKKADVPVPLPRALVPPAFLFCTTRTKTAAGEQRPHSLLPCTYTLPPSQPPPHPTLPNPSLHQPPHHTTTFAPSSVCGVVQERGFYTDPPQTTCHACPRGAMSLAPQPSAPPCLPHLAHASPLPLPSFVHDLQLICRERSLVVEPGKLCQGCLSLVCLLPSRSPLKLVSCYRRLLSPASLFFGECLLPTPSLVRMR